MTTSARSPITLSRAAWLRLALGLFIGLAAPLSQAQPSPDNEDPPARVARVADVQGDAWLFDDNAKEWTRLLRNQTLAEGDRLRTDANARVSLRAGSTSLWLDERSDLLFDRLDEGIVQLQLDHGDLAVQVRSNDAVGDLRVLTQQGRLLAEQPGLYRVEQLDRGTLARNWQGRLRYEPEGGGQPSWVEAGEQVEFWVADGPRAERQRLRSDNFGEWVVADSRATGGPSTVTQRYVSPEMTGAEDLDRYGSWDQSPDYGAVWFPTAVDPGWTPYRNGQWMWTRYWGWSWVDDSPWGFAPFHYGRWVQWRGRWCWTPGSYVARPVYAPALVAFVGGGVSVGINIGLGGGRRPPRPSGGWVPLAPREAYVPGYRHSDTYLHRLNNGRDVRPVQNPRNAAVAGAISREAVSRQPPVQVRPAADMPAWRNQRDQDRGRDNRDRGGRDREDNNNRRPGQAGQPAAQQPQVQGPQRVQPQQPQQQPQQQQQPNWRGNERDRDDRNNDRGSTNRGNEPRQPQPAQQVQPAPQPQQVQPSQPQPQRDWGRREAQPERGNEVREPQQQGRGRERQPEAQPQQVQQPRPQPQVQMPPPQAQAQIQQVRPQPAVQAPAAPPAERKTEDKPRNERGRGKEQQEH